MNLRDALDPRGQLTIQKTDARETLIETIHVHNNIVLSGRDLIAKLFAIRETTASVSHVEVGTGATPVKPADDKLAARLFRKPIVPIDASRHITTIDMPNGDKRRKVTITADLDFAEANGTLTEAGLFADTVMYNRVVFAPINKTADFKLTLIWEITF